MSVSSLSLMQSLFHGSRDSLPGNEVEANPGTDPPSTVPPSFNIASSLPILPCVAPNPSLCRSQERKEVGRKGGRYL